MRKYLLILFILLTASTWSVAQHQMPSYKSIVQSFFEKYNYKGKMHQLQFAKKTDGWYVNVQDMHGKIKEEALFWSKDDGKFQEVKKAISQAEHGRSLKNQKNYLSTHYKRYAYNMSRCPYYGYAGWEYDVINEFGKRFDQQPDTILEGVGRAASAYAMSFLRKDYGPVKNPDAAHFPAYQKVPSKNVNQFIKYVNLAIDAYGTLAKRNPGYETIVGDIHTKWSNENVYAWQVLMSVQEEKKAMKYLEKDLYSPFILSFARNFLDHCDENAILFTRGDNDTYPLWYLQQKEEYRTDIKVLNTSLLNTAYYNEMLRARYQDFPQFLPDQKIAANKCNFVLYDNDPKKPSKPMNLLDFMTAIKDDKGRVVEQISKDTIYTLPTKFLHIPGEEKSAEGISIVLSRYLLKGQLMLLDILAGNDWKAPIYFATTVSKGDMMGLDEYGLLEGTVTRLVDYSTDMGQTNQLFSTSNVDVLYENLMENFKLEAIPVSPKRVIYDRSVQSNADRVCQNSRRLFQQLARDLLQEGDHARTIKLLDRAEELIPHKKSPYHYLDFEMAIYYYQADAPEKGAKIAQYVIDHLKSINDHYVQNGNLVPVRFKNIKTKILEGLQIPIEKHQQTTLLSQIKELQGEDD